MRERGRKARRPLVFLALSAVTPVVWVIATFGLVSAGVCAVILSWDSPTADWMSDLHSPNAAERIHALNRYSRGRVDAPSPPPCALMAGMLLAEPDVREAGLSAVARVLQTGQCVENVVDVLRNAPSPISRAFAARALGAARRLDRARIVPALIRSVADSDSVAVATMSALAQLADTTGETRAAIRTAFQNGGASLVRASAMDAMARVGANGEVAMMARTALGDTAAGVRVAAVAALALFSHDQQSRTHAVRLILPLLSDESASVRRAASEAIQMLHSNDMPRYRP